MIFALFALALEAAFYFLFEMQNIWPFNEDLLPALRWITLIGIILSILLFFLPRWGILSPLPLAVSFIVVTILSRSEANGLAAGMNVLIIFLLFITARQAALVQT
jgi:hypothetical protein